MSDSANLLKSETRPGAGSGYPSAESRIRRGLLRSIAGLSCLLGVVLACVAASPAFLTSLSTAHLMGIILLCVGPVLTLFALRFDRGVAAQIVVSQSRTADAARSPRIAKHGAHDRTPRVRLLPSEPDHGGAKTTHTAPEKAA